MAGGKAGERVRGWRRAFAETVQWKRHLPFEYDSHSSGSHRGFCLIDLHRWFLCFPLCSAQCDLWATQAHTKTKGARLQMRYRFFFFANAPRASHGSTPLYSSPGCPSVFCLYSFCPREQHWPPSLTLAGITKWEDQSRHFDKSVGWRWLILSWRRQWDTCDSWGSL